MIDLKLKKISIKNISTVEHHELEHYSVVSEKSLLLVKLERTLVEILKISVPSDAENRIHQSNISARPAHFSELLV